MCTSTGGGFPRHLDPDFVKRTAGGGRTGGEGVPIVFFASFLRSCALYDLFVDTLEPVFFFYRPETHMYVVVVSQLRRPQQK